LSNNKKGEALELAKATSVELLEEKKSLHEILQSCKTICKYLGIFDKNTWIDLELNGYLGRYKTRDELYDNLPSYRKTSWSFYDVYGNLMPLPRDILDFFGKSIIYQPVSEIENNNRLIIGSQYLEKFNEFITKHGMDHASKNLRIHEAHIPKNELKQVIDGLKMRIQEFLDNMILVLE
jgi:AbiTii-like protein